MNNSAQPHLTLVNAQTKMGQARTRTRTRTRICGAGRERRSLGERSDREWYVVKD